MSRKEEKKERMNFSFFPTVEKCSKIPFRPSSGYSPLFLSQEKKKKENSVLFPPPFSVAFPFLSFFHNASTSIRNNRSHPSSSSSSPALPSSYTTKLGFVSIRRFPPAFRTRRERLGLLQVGQDLLSLRPGGREVADHVEGTLGQGVTLTSQDGLE